MNLLDESSHQKLVELLTNDLVLLLVEAAQALLHWLGTGSNLQGLLGDFPRYARHVRGTPCKHVSICMEKVNEHGLLFGVEVGTDCQHLVLRAIGVEQVFRAFYWLKAARMALRL